MATIKTRSGKGSPLTNAEVDANFNNLNTDKLEKTASFGGDVTGTYSNLQVKNDSHTHDGRYYTETEANARFAPVSRATVTLTQNTYARVLRISGDRLSSAVRLSLHGTANGVVVSVIADLIVNHSGDIHIASQSGDYTGVYIKVISDGNENFDVYLKYTTGSGTSLGLRADLFGLSEEGITWNPTATAYTGTSLEHHTGTGVVKYSQSSGNVDVVTDGNFWANGQKVFNDAYHPNADKWTTARTLSLSGDASGSVSWDGSANATLSVTVNNDSHNHNHSDGDFSIGGALTINGSTTRGTYTSLSQYHSGADNIVLKGNSSGISSIFFESEKDGTNINHTSDFGFIQFHPYGTGTSGESNELIIGVSNDADDHVILNAPSNTGLKYRVGASATDYAIFHDNYHPNADKWTTARTHTVTLTGDVTGSASQSVDGSGNKTWSITTAVADNSHNHNYVSIYDNRAAGDVSPDNLPDKKAYFTFTDDLPGTGNEWDSVINMAGWGNGYRAWQLASNSGNGSGNTGLYFRSGEDASWGTMERVFTTEYHPNADKWTTARTLSLTGDVTGSVSWDGSGNATLSTDWRGGTANTTVNMNNFNIENVNNLTFNDPGPNEGLEWKGGNGWKIYESPDDLVTNSGGNLQFVTGSTRRMTLSSDGNLAIDGSSLTVGMGTTSSNIYMTDSDNTTRRIHCNSNKIGFLTSSNGWGTYSDNSANWFATSSVRSPIFYDSANTSYYWNPNDSSAHKFQTPSGYIHIGPMNTSHCHLQTDRSNFYFNTEIRVDTGKIGSYNEDLQLRRAVNDAHKITIGAGTTTVSQDTVVQGTVQHNGLVMTSGTNVDQLYTHDKALTLTTSWQDTGVQGSMLPGGTYIVQVYAADYGSGGGQYYETYSGVMTWYSGDTNDTSWDEIPLHSAGHADQDRAIYLRTLRTATADTRNMVLQIAGDGTNTSAYTYTFKFRRMI